MASRDAMALLNTKTDPAYSPGTGSAVPRFLMGVLGTAVVSGLLSLLLLAQLEPSPGRVAPPGARQQASGSLSVKIPAALQQQPLRIDLLQSGQPVFENLPPAELAARSLKPGPYKARITYRGQTVLERDVQVQPGEAAALSLPLREIARIEYHEGVLADARRSGDGIPYFRRAARLDAKHIDARLQLAAYELLHGSAEAVRNHLRAIRALDPDNPDARIVERLLKQRLARER